MHHVKISFIEKFKFDGGNDGVESLNRFPKVRHDKMMENARLCGLSED